MDKDSIEFEYYYKVTDTLEKPTSLPYKSEFHDIKEWFGVKESYNLNGWDYIDNIHPRYSNLPNEIDKYVWLLIEKRSIEGVEFKEPSLWMVYEK